MNITNDFGFSIRKLKSVFNRAIFYLDRVWEKRFHSPLLNRLESRISQNILGAVELTLDKAVARFASGALLGGKASHHESTSLAI